MMERTPETNVTEIWLHGRPYRVDREVGFDLANIFGRKVNQGDPGPDDHPTHSTSIQVDWSGGGLVKYMNPASDTGRFHKSTAETQYPNCIALPPKTFEFEAPGNEPGSPYAMGDFNGYPVFVWHESIYILDQINNSWSLVGSITGGVANSGTVYREASDTTDHDQYMFLPTAAGYATLSTGWIVEDGTALQQVIDFEVWDDKIFRLMGDGTLWWSTKKPEAEGDWTYSGAVPDGSTPRRLISFMTKQGEPCLFVVTDATTWKHDFANTMLHRDDLEFPRHPDQGRAAKNHRGEVWVSVGTGIHRYDNNTISPQGLDSRDGLDPEFRGFIVDMESTYNGLYVLVQGRSVGDDTYVEQGQLLAGPGGNSFMASSQPTFNMIQMWNGFGWHHRWHELGSPPTNIRLSNVQGVYRIYWGSNDRLYMQIMPRVYFNPADPDTRGYPFAPYAEHESSWNAWGWVGQDKIMKQIELYVEKIEPGAKIEVFYKIDKDDNPWEVAGIIQEDGEYRFYVGQDLQEPLIGGRGHYRGVRHERYKLLFRIYRGPTESISPVIKWHSVIARRWLRPQRVWTLDLNLSAKIKDYTIEQQLRHLIDIATNQEAVVFEHQDDKYMADLVAINTRQLTGRDERSTVRITLMEANDLDRYGMG